MKHDFQQRKQHRIDHAKEMATKLKEQSSQLSQQAMKMSEAIPMGQPILVGHHSEKWDRNYRNKIHNKWGQSIEAEKKAGYYTDKAATIEKNTAISSDDPQALQQLQQKVDSLTKKQEFMKMANRCIKKKDQKQFLQYPGTHLEDWERLNTPDPGFGKGFAAFELTNNNVEIKRLKKRIVLLEQTIAMPDLDITVDNVRLVTNKAANRVQFFFPSDPGTTIKNSLYKNGFIWYRTGKAWQRKLTPAAAKLASRLLQEWYPATRTTDQPHQ